MSLNSSRRSRIKEILRSASSLKDPICKIAESEGAASNISKLQSGEIAVSKDSDLSKDKKLVEFIQSKMIESGLEISLDGIFGTETEKAVKEVQELFLNLNLLPQGVIIPGVVDHLFIDTLSKVPRDLIEAAGVSVKADELIPKRDNLGGPVYIGSSSLEGVLGRLIKSKMGSGIATFAKVGSQPAYWVGSNWQLIEKAIAQGPNKIVVVTGGNGIAGAEELLSKIKDAIKRYDLSGTEIIWFGASPFGANSADTVGPYHSTSPYEYLQSGSSFKEATNRRRSNNSVLEGLVSSVEGVFVDPFDYLKLKDGSPGYYCPSGCDGVHLTESAAEKLVSGASGII